MTATINELSLELSVIEHLDFDFEPPCEAVAVESGKPMCKSGAQWKVAIGCCGATVIVCEKHKDVLIEFSGFIAHDQYYNPCGSLFVKVISVEKL